MSTLPAAVTRNASGTRSRFAPAAAAATLLAIVAATSPPQAVAATPAAATISEATSLATWTGPLMPATAAGCGGAADPSCDNFRLTVAPPSPGFGPYVVEIRLQPVGDWDLQAYDPADRFLKGSGAGPNVGEIVQLYNPAAGTYTIAAAAFAPLAGPDVDGDLVPDSYSATAELKHQPASPNATAAGEAVGFSNHAWPAGNGANCGDSPSGFCGGEPSIGVNGNTGKVMYAAGVPLQTLRVTFDGATPPNATWQNVSHVWTQTPRAFADPLLFTDKETGRTFALQLEGLTPFSTMAFTDDDGASWTPSQGSGVASGIDHQTVGGGPFAPPLTRDPDGPLYPNAVYYCAQELVAANCARSDDGGLTFGPAVTIYTTECGGLHGHLKVAPDGTVYVPNKGCSGGQGVVVSEDNGLSWTVRKVPGSGTGDSDPSVAIASDGTVYFAFQDGDGHPKVAVSHDKGATWDTYGPANAAFQDVGAPFGIRNTAFPEMVAGDPLRAAFAFLGTTTGGGMQDASFAGVWHLYVASTYDGGATWTTVDATPNDPVQRGCIWLGGGSNQCRNLLDFNDATVDEQGRVLVAYADGCTGACVASAAANTYSAGATIARQSTGRRMYAAFDDHGGGGGGGGGDDDPCTPPGVEIVADDRVNDATDGLAAHDVIRTSVSYPFNGDGAPDRLVFTMQVGSLDPLVPGSIYFTSFTVDGNAATAGNVYGVRMVVGPTGVPSFESYQAAASNAGTVDGRFVEGSKPAESGSTYEPGGKITIAVAPADVGLPSPLAGHTLTLFNGGAAQTTAELVTLVVDWMPTGGDGIVDPTPITRTSGSFAVQSNQSCNGSALTSTSTALASTPNPADEGEPVTFTATVSGEGGTPTGTVTFKEGAIALGAGALDGSGTAAFTTSALAVGSHVVTAHYGGDATFAASVSAAVTQVVGGVVDATGARFDILMSPPGVAESWGEPSIGINWTSERSFSNSAGAIPNGGTLMSYGGINVPTAFRVTPNDCPSPARALWEPTAPLLLAGAPRALGDPIMWTDRDTGRTIVSQLLGGTWTSTAEITDDDGRTFTPSQGSGIVSGIDHQTIGGGPFHAPLSSPLYRNAVYYCSQDVADAVCSLSVDGGRTFGPAVPIFTRAECNGLHGHVKVAPDGTVYVPVKGCGGSDVTFHADGNQAVAMSENNGATWEVRLVDTSTVVAQSLTGASTQAWDPSVAIASDGTLYFGYQAQDGKARVAVSLDKGQSWIRDTDVGAALGIRNTSFPAMVAGDPERAAFAFFGTTTGGTNYDQPGFPGVWYLYVATTYDGGQSWSIVNATPGDPIQRGGICGGGTCRNLLDFFDAGVDKEGRIVVGYDDGCVTPSCIAGGGNDFTAKGAIARQSGGRRMFAVFDPVEPGLPKAPDLTATLDPAGNVVHLRWTTPDGSGEPVASYTVYRREGGGAITPIAAVAGTTFDDDDIVPGTAYSYRVTATNDVGEGPYCGEATPVGGGGGGNGAPVAAGDSASTARDTAVPIAVLQNDSDPDGDPLRLAGVAQPANGVAVDNGDGTVTYAPNGGFSGSDSFAYTISDGRGGAASATVTVAVSAAGSSRPPQFGHDAIVDLSATGGEPYVKVGPPGTPVEDQIFVSAPFGFSTTVSLLWKSIDDGASFIPLGTPIVRDGVVGPGGGDTAQDFDHLGRFYYADLSAACVTAAVSDDGGNTFPPERNNWLTCIGGGDDVEGVQDDRQWVAAFGDGRGYVTVRNLAVGVGEGNFHLFRTRDAGLTWNGMVLGTVGQSGPLQVDKKKRKVLVAGVERDAIVLYQVHTGLNLFRITDLDDGSMPTGVNRPIVNTPNVLFPVLAIDSAGNLYVTWSDGTNVYLRTSRDRGDSWSPTTQVNPPALTGANIMPWIVAGDAGRIDVVWYRTAGTNGPGAVWDIYMAQSLNALAAPAFTVGKVSETVIHRGEICLRGLSCDLPQDPVINPQGPGDRSFLEFPSIDKDSRGMAVITFNDNTNQAAGPGVAGGSYVMVTRQTSGESLFVAEGSGPAAVAVTQPVAGATVPPVAVTVAGTHTLSADDRRADPTGDARFPDHGAAIGPNVPALDIRKMTLTDDASTIIVKMEIADLTPAALATAAAQSGGDGVLYLAQWDYLDRVWWVAMEVRGTLPRFYTGTLGIIKSATSKKYITYNPELGPSAQVTGAITPGAPGTVTIYVPRYMVGPAAAGGAMFTVTGYALSERGPLLPAGSTGEPNPSSLPLQVDAAGPFTHIVADGAAVDGVVEISIDDPTFASPRTTAPAAGGTWSTTVSGLGLGTHTVYARQRGRGREATAAAPVHFTVGGP